MYRQLLVGQIYYRRIKLEQSHQLERFAALILNPVLDFARCFGPMVKDLSIKNQLPALDQILPLLPSLQILHAPQSHDLSGFFVAFPAGLHLLDIAIPLRSVRDFTQIGGLGSLRKIALGIHCDSYDFVYPLFELPAIEFPVIKLPNLEDLEVHCGSWSRDVIMTSCQLLGHIQMSKTSVRLSAWINIGMAEQEDADHLHPFFHCNHLNNIKITLDEAVQAQLAMDIMSIQYVDVDVVAPSAVLLDSICGWTTVRLDQNHHDSHNRMFAQALILMEAQHKRTALMEGSRSRLVVEYYEEEDLWRVQIENAGL